MLNVFPELLNYSQIAPFILRLVLAFAIFLISLPKIKSQDKKEKILGFGLTIGAILVFLGFLMQVGALLIIIFLAAEKSISEKFGNEKKLKILALAIAVSLMLLGPGILSFDLPL